MPAVGDGDGPFHGAREYTDMRWVLAQKPVALAGMRLGAILEADLKRPKRTR